MKPDVKFNPGFMMFKAVEGPLPCGCGQAIAKVEKAGRSLCASCAKNYSGREMPIRSGAANCRVITVSA